MLRTPNALTRWLARLIYESRPARDPDRVISDRPPGEDDYMRRWYLVPRNRWGFNIYLHHILRSDAAEAMHDHPWWSLSLVLRGSVVEVDDAGRATLVAGAARYRSSGYRHRLEIAPHTTVWTLFVTGPVVREWGFHCPRGWVPWQQFTAPGIDGRAAGCGEETDK